MVGYRQLTITPLPIPLAFMDLPQVHHTTNCIPFPVPRSPEMSVISTKMTALDVCQSVYGEGGVGSDTVDSYYEPNASMWLIYSLLNLAHSCTV